MAGPQITRLLVNGVPSPGRGLPLYLSGINANTTPDKRFYGFQLNHLKIQGLDLSASPKVTPTVPTHKVISLETMPNLNGTEIDHWFLCYLDNDSGGGAIPDPIDMKVLSTLTVTVETTEGTTTQQAGSLAIIPPPPPRP